MIWFDLVLRRFYPKLGGVAGGLVVVLGIVWCGRAGALYLARRAIMGGRDKAGRAHTLTAFSLSRLLLTIALLSYLPIVRICVEAIDCVPMSDSTGAVRRVLQVGSLRVRSGSII